MNKRKKVHSWRYRLINGTSWEGISVREVYYDINGNILGWSHEPLLMIASNPDEIKKEIINAMKDLDNMLMATKEPVLDEAYLEETVK